MTVYRLSQDLSSIESVHHLRAPIRGVGGPDSAFALDPDHLWIGFVDLARGGRPARLDRTSDGGATWQVSPYARHDFHGGSGDEVLFSSPDVGLQITYSGVAEYAAVYRTSNGGASWTLVSSNRHGHLRRAPAIGPIYVTADGSLWQIENLDVGTPVLTHSTDGGREWHVIKLPRRLASKIEVDSATAVGDAVLVSYTIRHITPHHCRFGVLSYEGGAWTNRHMPTLRCPDTSDGDGAIATASTSEWTVRPDAGMHPVLVTTSNAGRTWTVQHVPARVDGPYGEATLTMQSGGTALLSNQYYAPSAGGPWRRLKLP